MITKIFILMLLMIILFLMLVIGIVFYYMNKNIFVNKNCEELKRKFIKDSAEKNVIVLGAKFERHRPCPMLQARLDFIVKNKIWLDKEDVVIILSGGQGEDEVASEAELMASYLRLHLRKANIKLEDKSSSTYENMLHSRDLIRHSSVYVITNSFHEARVKKNGKLIGYDKVQVFTVIDHVNMKNYLTEFFALIKTYLVRK